MSPSDGIATTLDASEVQSQSLSGTRPLLGFWVRERSFLGFLVASLLLVGATYQTPYLAMWVGFLFAGYSAVANDSIQTLGTFIASNHKQRWWVLWLFIASVFLVTVTYSWLQYDGDVSYQRLAAKGFITSPTSFSFLQVAAPIVLLILTRMGIPVSTTFLLLSCFAASASSVGSVLTKSVSGYLVAFGFAFAVWLALSKAMERWFRGEAHPAWRPAQWVTTALLWSVWLMQDAANVAVFLPRSLGIYEFAVFALVIVAGLGVLLYMRGERVQHVVTNKSQVVDVRMATVIDLVYTIILYLFKMESKIPMSTTWVFIGLLAGREIAMVWRGTTDRSFRVAVRMIGKDLLYVTIGLLVSILLAFSVNEAFREGVRSTLGL